MPYMKTRASYHALADSSRAANATSLVRSITCVMWYLSETIPSW